MHFTRGMVSVWWIYRGFVRRENASYQTLLHDEITEGYRSQGCKSQIGFSKSSFSEIFLYAQHLSMNL